MFVLYPGGLVRPQAYEWLGHALAARGVETVIPEMPLDLAVLGTDRATALIDRYAAGRPVVLGGHSLGGAMAASYAAKNPAKLSGLILMAAYPAEGDSPFSYTHLDVYKGQVQRRGQPLDLGHGFVFFPLG